MQRGRVVCDAYCVQNKRTLPLSSAREKKKNATTISKTMCRENEKLGACYPRSALLYCGMEVIAIIRRTRSESEESVFVCVYVCTQRVLEKPPPVSNSEKGLRGNRSSRTFNSRSSSSRGHTSMSSSVDRPPASTSQSERKQENPRRSQISTVLQSYPHHSLSLVSSCRERIKKWTTVRPVPLPFSLFLSLPPYLSSRGGNIRTAIETRVSSR